MGNTHQGMIAVLHLLTTLHAVVFSELLKWGKVKDKTVSYTGICFDLPWLLFCSSSCPVRMKRKCSLLSLVCLCLLIVLPSQLSIIISGVVKAVQATGLSGFQPVFATWELSPLYGKQQNMLSLQPGLQRQQQVLCDFL